MNQLFIEESGKQKAQRSSVIEVIRRFEGGSFHPDVDAPARALRATRRSVIGKRSLHGHSIPNRLSEFKFQMTLSGPRGLPNRRPGTPTPLRRSRPRYIHAMRLCDSLCVSLPSEHIDAAQQGGQALARFHQAGIASNSI